MISPHTGYDQIIDVSTNAIRVKIKKRKDPILTSDLLLSQLSKIDMWGPIVSLAICEEAIKIPDKNDYISEPVQPLFLNNAIIS